METTQQVTATSTRRDIHQQVTDTIIKQLEQGTVPWHKPWKGNDQNVFSIPKNLTTGNNIAASISCCYGVPPSPMTIPPRNGPASSSGRTRKRPSAKVRKAA